MRITYLAINNSRSAELYTLITGPIDRFYKQRLDVIIELAGFQILFVQLSIIYAAVTRAFSHEIRENDDISRAFADWIAQIALAIAVINFQWRWSTFNEAFAGRSHWSPLLLTPKSCIKAAPVRLTTVGSIWPYLRAGNWFRTFRKRSAERCDARIVKRCSV